ncbi:MAG: energy transducer TonB [Ferruginibacter sp.]
MNEENKNIVYTAADIARYLSGKMTAAEMHALEKAALDDPFLEEAIEGYAGAEQKDWSNELGFLKDGLEKKEDTPVIVLTKNSSAKWWRAAAAVLVIGSSIAVAYLTTSNKNQHKTTPELAKVTDADSGFIAYADSVTANTAIADSLSVAVLEKKKSDASAPAATVETAKEQTGTKQLKEEEHVKSVTADEIASKKLPEETPGVSVSAAERPLSDNETASKKQPADANMGYSKNGAFYDKAKAEEGVIYRNNNFSAQVVTEDNKPVAFAQVNIPKNKSAVYTDANGNFTISTADSVLDVVVLSSGYDAKRSRLEPAGGGSKIILDANNLQLAETVAVGKKAKARKDMRRDTILAGADIDEDAAPLVGWDEYNNYLSNNLVLPGEAKAKNIHGTVEVFVKLSGDGDIKEVKVSKPLCTGCDAEAVRLIKEGPKWDVKSNKSTKVKVKVNF